MDKKLGTLILAAFGIVFSYIIFWVGNVFRPITYKTFGTTDIAGILQGISLFAADHSWMFIIPIALVFIAGIFLYRLRPDAVPQVTVAALCFQALFLWSALFCYFYMAFQGPVSMYHDSKFDAHNFFLVAGEAFPVTLAAILVPCLYELSGCSRRNDTKR